jgi:hypothetical protein
MWAVEATLWRFPQIVRNQPVCIGSRCSEILEAHGIDVVLVNAHSIKNVSGHKSDVLDCQWLQEFFIYRAFQWK